VQDKTLARKAAREKIITRVAGNYNLLVNPPELISQVMALGLYGIQRTLDKDTQEYVRAQSIYMCWL
jgi:hypothetical protein